MTMNPRDIDELASAQLDGEATADERARLADDPAGARRLAELAAARDLLRDASPDLPVDVVDAQITAALDAAISPSVSAGTGGTVVSMRRRRAVRWATSAATAAGVAAVALFLGGVLGVFGGEEQQQFAQVGGSISSGDGSSADMASAPEGDVARDELGPSALEATPAAGADSDSANLHAYARGFEHSDVRALAPIAPVRDDEELKVAVARLLDESARLRVAATDAPFASATSTTLPSAPQCPAEEAAAAQVVTTALLGELAADDLLIVASVRTVLDGDAVTVLLLSTAPDAPIATMLVRPDDGCAPARVL